MKKLPRVQEERNMMTRVTRRKEQESLKHTQTPSSPLAHSTKEVGNKKTKEEEDQGHKMTRGNKKKGTIVFGKQEEKNKKKRNKMTTRRKAHALNQPVPNSSF